MRPPLSNAFGLGIFRLSGRVTRGVAVVATFGHDRSNDPDGPELKEAPSQDKARVFGRPSDALPPATLARFNVLGRLLTVDDKGGDSGKSTQLAKLSDLGRTALGNGMSVSSCPTTVGTAPVAADKLSNCNLAEGEDLSGTPEPVVMLLCSPPARFRVRGRLRGKAEEDDEEEVEWSNGAAGKTGWDRGEGRLSGPGKATTICCGCGVSFAKLCCTRAWLSACGESRGGGSPRVISFSPSLILSPIGEKELPDVGLTIGGTNPAAFW